MTLKPSTNQKKNPTIVKTNDGWTIIIHSMLQDGSFYDEFPPTPRFYKIQKQFYPNGKMKQKSIIYSENLKVGIWEYYNEEGKLIKEVNEDEKFKKSNVTIKKILEILQNDGWIDQKTGKGEIEISINNEIYVDYKFDIMFTENENKESVWYVNIPTDNNNVMLYIINAETGDVTKEDVTIIGYE